MKFDKIFLFTTIFVAIFSFTSRHLADNPETWVIESKSKLKVDGKTNVNSFTCEINGYGRIDTLVYNLRSHTGNISVTGNMNVDVHSFDCHRKAMTKDLLKTLKADQHPHMKIKFISFSQRPIDLKPNEKMTGKVEIELAGVKRQFEVQYQLNRSKSQSLELLGTRQLHFSDFDLKPPSKLGGTIKVKNELEVEFILHLTRLA